MRRLTMTGDRFRRLALGMDGAVEGAHMGHPDFRVGGRIFATLTADETAGVVMLTPDQQQEFVAADPRAFGPASGAWGRQGSTVVQLASVDEGLLGEAMTISWQNAVRKGPSKPARKRTTAARPRRRRP
jgi:hypothetical protein